MKYRMIPFQYFNAFMNMALDEAIMEEVRKGTSLPTIRFYGWTPSAVSIGIFQGIRNEVNLEEARLQGVDVVRRMTGGGAVYHDEFGEVTYSLIAPQDQYSANIVTSYEEICQGIIHALLAVDIQASFQPVNDILVKGQKISGNAQTRKNGVLLQHGTILYQVDVETMFTLLNVSEVKISDKLIKSVKKRVTSIQEQVHVSMEVLQKALEVGFSLGNEIVVGSYSQGEMIRAKELAEQKFSSEAWNFKL
jgi:lipoate-protein ligase A